MNGSGYRLQVVLEHADVEEPVRTEHLVAGEVEYAARPLDAVRPPPPRS